MKIHRPPTPEPCDPELAADPARKLLYIALLVAIRDRASEVHFEPVRPGEVFRLEWPPWWKPEGGYARQRPDSFTVPPVSESYACRLRYRVADTWYDMPPPPIGTAPISTEVDILAKLIFPYGGLWSLCAGLYGFFIGFFFRRFYPAEGPIRFLLGSKGVDVLACVQPDAAYRNPGPRVSLRLLNPNEASEEAKQILNAYFERKLAARSNAGTGSGEGSEMG